MPESENIAVVRRMVDAWNRRDLDTIVAAVAEDAEFVNSPTAVEPGTRRGTEEGRAVLRAQWDILLDGHQEIERLYDRGDEVISLVRLSRRMPGSDMRISEPSLTLFTFRDGKVARVQVLGFGTSEVDGALKAAGLDKSG